VLRASLQFSVHEVSSHFSKLSKIFDGEGTADEISGPRADGSEKSESKFKTTEILSGTSDVSGSVGGVAFMVRFLLLLFFLTTVDSYPRSNIRRESDRRNQTAATPRSRMSSRMETATNIDFYHDKADQMCYQRR
jgi:hypothetical protein